ncbi:MAG: hypothetical protein PHI28_13800, partial [Mangrovibacterium sp.]|nr:hypothetical protein [Mangrovibacterium sp.]
LLASAIVSPGIPRVLSGIMSPGEKDKLWKTDIPKSYAGKTFKELSAYFRERQAIVIGVMREKKTDSVLGCKILLNLAKIISTRLRKANEDTIKLTTVLSIVLNETGS